MLTSESLSPAATPYASASRPPNGSEPRTDQPPRVVAIGGGTGLPVVLRGLCQAADQRWGRGTNEWLTAVVTVMDDGGSSGRLRRELGILPPGDIRNCVAAMIPEPSPFSDLLQRRILPEPGFSGHPIGNLLLAGLAHARGDFLAGINALRDLTRVTARVLPATLEHVHLRATFQDGTDVIGESAIARRGVGIKRLALERRVSPLPSVIDAIAAADLIIVGPGSLYTSIIPNLLVDGITEAIAAARGTRVYVANLMTQPGETDGYSLEDHLQALETHTGSDLFDYVLVSRSQIDAFALAQYAHDGAQPVKTHAAGRPRRNLVEVDTQVSCERGKIRHDPATLGPALLDMEARYARPQGRHRATA